MEILKQFDIALFWLINSHHSRVFDVFFGTITYLGNGWVVAPILLGLMVWKMPRRFWIQAILCGVISLSVAGWMNTDIKTKVNRPRPVLFFEQVYDSSSNNPHCAAPEDLNFMRVHIVGQVLREHSFPSGHANTAAGAALLLGILFGGAFWWSFLAAAFVAYSRVYCGVHFPLDTLAGSVLGCALTGAITAIFIRAQWLPAKKQT